jgi:apolipoprotein N-acyltransferase
MCIAIFRAVENHRYLARAASTGISCFIDPNGRILTSAGERTRALLRHNVRLENNITFYTRHGDFMVLISILLIAGIILATTWQAIQAANHKLE